MKKSLLILCGMLLSVVAYAQSQRRVTGTVKTKDGTAVIASIKVKGTSQGTASRNDGTYVLEQVPANAVLICSSVGYKSVEIPISGKTTVDVVLEPDNQSLDEVMVVAYGTAKKGTYTGSAAVIRNDEIKDPPVTSFQNALNGKAPGIQVTNSSGQAGSAPSVRIRGVGSMNASNEPLYVIDGVPMVSGDLGQMGGYLYNSNNVMNSINPADIESITILKDAAASALYGSRAANGVIVINTKRGQEGKPLINLKSSVAITPSFATDNYEVASLQDQVNMLYQVFYDYRTANGDSEAEANGVALGMLDDRFNQHGYYFETNGTGLYENVQIKGMTDGLVNREGNYFDWDKVLFRTAVYQTNDLSVSGGNSATKYYSSLSYTKDQSRIAINNLDRITGRVNLSQKVGKYVDFLSNVGISHDKTTGFNDTRNTSSNYFFEARNLLWPLYWPTDYKTGEPWTDRYGSYAYNAEYYNKEWENGANTTRISANETVTIHILPELNVKSVFSYDNTDIKEHLYYSANHFEGSTSNGSVDEMNTNVKKLVSSTTINYDKTFGLHSLGLLVGFEAEKNQTDFMRASGIDLPASSLHTVATAGETNASAYRWGNNMQSILSRVEYNYNQRYYLSASFRRDGSSKLAPNNRWGNFWSVAGSWRISEEAFMKDMTALSNLRVRASYGVNGTFPIDNYGWRTLTGYAANFDEQTGGKYMEQSGGAIIQAGNPDLTWESNYTTNLAVEFGLFDQRLYGTVEYFNRNSKDLLQDVRTSMVTGFGSILKNVGEINNRGFEIDLGYDIIRSGDWRWNAGVNASFIQSKVTKLYKNPGEEKVQDIIWKDPTGGDDRAQYIYREGESTYSFYGYESAGVNPENGRQVWYVNDPDDPTVGDFIYNGRPATYDYSNAYYTILGSALPKVYGGLNTNVEYKGISLGLGFIYKLGGYLYDGAFKDVADDGYYWERIRAEYYQENRWTPSHTNGTLPKIEGVDLTDAIQYSSRQMHSASFLRLKNINLAYRIPTQLTNKIGIANARIYVNGTNLLTFSKYKIADPEVNNYGTRGWELPIGKTYTFGVELTF
ncbi:TonB-dependent receptor [Olivibacter ginsenosidimutans]|uniref:TonB-dependent receptor n=1 Tax=Olivibacter ginsenosidimutans TaxID=1176537 RepID=A0ABP9BBD2_9SPHI